MSTQSPADLTLEGLVHDLNNVFETIQEAADLLAKDAKHARLAAALRRGVSRGTRILGSYLEYSQELLDFELILDTATEFAHDFLRAVKGPRIEFIRKLEPGLRLRGNPAAWERVLVNLILNAAQAMESDGTVEITATRTAASIEITITDDGPGISPKVLPQIFEPRFSTRAKRSGLGLHIVKTIVENNGGSVTAANGHSGRGAVFHIQLPQ
ncbi:MAG: HAMP domain-containing histidine kinase [Acidimicrobiia bacterium]|nr:HAMP domain-containing histidine kinase [Acidimicrobiia bacterium]